MKVKHTDGKGEVILSVQDRRVLDRALDVLAGLSMHDERDVVVAEATQALESIKGILTELPKQ